MTEISTTARNATLEDMVTLLRQQADLKYDIVSPASSLYFENGDLWVRDGATLITDEGVSLTDAMLRPTAVFDEGISERLNIPRRYVRRMRDEAPGLLDSNVNHWLEADPAKQWLVRGFRTDDPTQPGIARAFLSDRYRAYDNLDVLMATLEGIAQGGAPVDIVGADLSERKMTVKVVSPAVEALAPVLLKGYRTPFDDSDPGRAAQAARHGWLAPDDRPVVFAGFVVSNSETGGGAFSITPRLMVKVCRNGLVIKKDALRSVHLGAQMDAGVVRWADDTHRKNLDLIAAQARDAVSTFLDVEYVKSVIARLEEAADVPVAEPIKAVEKIGKTFGYTQSEQDRVLEMFLTSGQRTAAGLANAVTAMAQVVDDPDRANELEESALDVLTITAANR